MDELCAQRQSRQSLRPVMQHPRVAAGHIGRTVQAVMISVEEIRQSVVDLVHSSPDGDVVGPTRADLLTLHPLLEQILKRHGRLLAGAGFVAAPELLQDAARWLEWRTGAEDKYFRLDVALDADQLDYYDYVKAEWFRIPRDGAPSAIVGPYVDLGGTNAYIVTLTVPVLVRGTFVGVVGADLLVDRIEGIVLRMTRTIGLGCPAAVVVNQEGRVLASSVPRQAPGTLLRELDLTVPDGDWAGPGLRAYECEGLPWKLVVLTCADPPACPLPCATPVG